MAIERFEDILVWQKAREFSLKIYLSFDKINDFGFKGQIERAAVSVMNNIAEGYERKSNIEFKQFLYIAKGSAGEVRSMLYLAKDLGILNEERYDELMGDAETIAKMLSNFIKKL